MRGNILAFSATDNRGVISGMDGNRYNFVRLDWCSQNAPVEGAEVDFAIDGTSAKEIFAMAPASGSDSDKKILPLFLICWFVGIFGIHRFMTGKVVSGILQLLTLGGLGFWTLFDWIMIMTGNFRDGQGRKITQWT